MNLPTTRIQAVASVPERAKNAIITLRALQEQGHRNAAVVWDETTEGDPAGTFRRCLEQAGDGAYIHLEDDLTISRHWAEYVGKAVAQRPDQVIQFFSFEPYMYHGWTRVPSYQFAYLQCVYFPPGVARDMAAWLGERRLDTGTARWSHDLFIRQWLVKSGYESYYVRTPHAVQHRTYQSTIMGGRPRNRISRYFLDDVEHQERA